MSVYATVSPWPATIALLIVLPIVCWAVYQICKALEDDEDGERE